jgi:signal transduction histidine kinase
MTFVRFRPPSRASPGDSGHAAYVWSPERRDTAFDALTMAAAVALVAVAVLGPPNNAAYGPAGIAVQCVLVASLPFRRCAPLLVGWLTTAAAAAMTVVELAAPGTLVRTDLDTAGITPWVPLATTPFATYATTAFTTDRRVAGLPAAILTIIAARPWDPSGQRITQGVLLVAGPALLGMYVAARRRLLQTHVEQALADERARLAADLHDTITHQVSRIVLRAGVLGMAARDETTRAAAEDLRTAGCQALEELQELVHVMRDHDAPHGNRPAAPDTSALVPELAALIAESESTELIVRGDPIPLSPVVRRTAHRIVQESLTNVRKHAPGADVQVHVRYSAGSVRLTVRDTGPAHAVDPALISTGSGAGLHNLRQRVELIGGALRAGPAPGGGFQVEATLPEPAA